MNDKINHPSHYTSHPSGIECIEIARHYDFNIGNAIKYIWRNGLKNGESSVEDLKKAIWYLNDYIKNIESNKLIKKSHTEEYNKNLKGNTTCPKGNNNPHG